MSRLRGSGASSKRAGTRIAAFYLVMLGGLAAAMWYFPTLQDVITLDLTPASSANSEITRTMAGGSPLQGSIPQGWESIWVTAVSLIGALLIMIPVAWTYILIKRDAGYEESVVHTLLILPVAVAGIVTIVQGSLALAFSLAGIVAAVRFRTTLDDTKDAVYVFLAIGVGLAAGVQALGVAVALSLVFNVVNLILWRLNFGNIYADQLHRTGGLGLGTVIAGAGSNLSAVGFGDHAAVGAPLAPASLDAVNQQQQRIRQQLHRESPVAKERKQFSALLLYTREVDTVKGVLGPILEEMTVRYQLAEVVPGERDGVSAVTYLVRIRDGITEAELVEAVRHAHGGSIEAAELRSLRALARD